MCLLHKKKQCLLIIIIHIGRVCVPIEIESVNSFDPSEVPTVNKICNELGVKNSDGSGEKGLFVSYMNVHDCD